MANFGGSWLSEFERIAIEKGWNISKEARFQGDLAKKIQQGINLIAKNFKGYDPSVASVNVKVDGKFGPKSMAAFDRIRQAVMKPEFMKLYGHDRKYHELRSKLHAPEGSADLWNDGLTDLAEMFMEGNPAQRFVQKHREMSEGIKDHIPGQKPAAPASKPSVGDSMPPLQEVEVGGQVKEHIFEPKRSAQVIKQLVKLANDLDEMGAEEAAIVVDEHLRNYKKASEELYDVFGETGEDLVNMAHPGGGPTIAPASEEGGKVETQVEEHKKLIDKVNKAPTGKIASVNLHQWYAGLNRHKQREVRNYVSMLMQRGMDKNEALAKAYRSLRIVEPEVQMPRDTMPELKEVEVGGEVTDHIPRFAADKPPKKYREEGATKKSDYADPDNFKYPIHTEKNVRAALSYFSKPKNYNAYSVEERGKIWSRIKSAAKKYKIELDPDNDPPWGKKSKAYVDAIQKLVKKANALEEAGKAEAAQAVDKAIRELQETVLPFVSRSSADEAAGSEDSKASVKFATEKRYEKLIPVWDALVEGAYNKLHNKIVSFWNYKNVMHGSQPPIVHAYANASKQIKHVASVWNEAYPKTLSHHIGLIAKTLDMGENTYDNMNQVFWGDKGVHKAVNAHEKMVSGFYDLAKKFSTLGAATPKEKAPAKAASKELKRYRGTIKSLTNFISKNRDFVRFFLGNPKLSADARRHEGSAKLKQLAKWLNEERKKPYGAEDADMANINLWNKVLQPLRQGLERKNQPVALQESTQPQPDFVQPQPQSVAHLGENMVKVAVPFTVMPGGGTSTSRPGKAPARRPGRTRRREDPNVKALQQAMVSAGVEIAGRNPVDGIWGKNTWNAYLNLQESIQARYPRIKFPMAGPKTPPKSFDLPLRAAKALAQESAKAVSKPIPIADGKEIPGSAMRNHKAFISALALNGIIERTDHAQEMASQAHQVLAQFVQRLKSDEDFTRGLQIELGNSWPNLLRSVQRIAQKLTPYASAAKVKKQEQAPAQQSSNRAPTQSPSAKINFNPNDLRSIKSAIMNLNEANVSNYSAFRDNVLGDYNADVKAGYKEYYPQVIALMRALQKHKQIISQTEGPKVYEKLFDKLNMYRITLNRNVGSHFRR